MRVVVAFALSAIVFATNADAQGFSLSEVAIPLDAPRPPPTSSVFSGDGIAWR
jgi:hypothetical protein